jgi:hypothetical protein
MLRAVSRLSYAAATSWAIRTKSPIQSTIYAITDFRVGKRWTVPHTGNDRPFYRVARIVPNRRALYKKNIPRDRVAAFQRFRGFGKGRPYVELGRRIFYRGADCSSLWLSGNCCSCCWRRQNIVFHFPDSLFSLVSRWTSPPSLRQRKKSASLVVRITGFYERYEVMCENFVSRWYRVDSAGAGVFRLPRYHIYDAQESARRRAAARHYRTTQNHSATPNPGSYRVYRRSGVATGGKS